MIVLVSRSLTRLPDILPPRDNLRVAFIVNASTPYATAPWVGEDVDSLGKFGYEVTVVDTEVHPATGTFYTPGQFSELLSASDVVYVAGGNTFYLAQTLTFPHDLVGTLTRHVREGLEYVGASAGAVLAGHDYSFATQLDNPAEAPSLHPPYLGLGLTSVTALPHWGNPKYQPAYDEMQLEDFAHPDVHLFPIRDTEIVAVEPLPGGERERITVFKD